MRSSLGPVIAPTALTGFSEPGRTPAAPRDPPWTPPVTARARVHAVHCRMEVEHGDADCKSVLINPTRGFVPESQETGNANLPNRNQVI